VAFLPLELHAGPAKKKMKTTAIIETLAVPARAVPVRGGKRNLRRSWKKNLDKVYYASIRLG
jgi:hypothetical protein